MKKWELIQTEKSSSVEQVIDILLSNRGLKTKEEVNDFLNPKLTSVTSEFVGIDKKHLTKTLRRIKKAIEKKEQVVVYGDYDVDGITGSAILWETLYALGAKAIPYIPHRVEEGYGLSQKGIENLLEQVPNISLIITVDNGIVANSAVSFANSKNIDVIITDHHVSQSGEENLPEAFAIVHTTRLCGAGVAYVLSKEIGKFIDAKTVKDGKTLLSIEDNNEDVHLELATLGTVADLVPLTGANRTIVKYGLEKLCNTKRHGLLALFQEAACERSTLGVYEIGHVIAPRLNAAGRLESAMDALRLLCTKDPKRAADLAAKLGFTNKERQAIMLEATKHASLSVKARKELKKLLVVSHESYQEGVIGLVAGRLVEEYYRPSIVISRGKKLSKGSVRSVSGFNIIEFLRSLSDYFVNVGGHPMAAGFTIETDKIQALQDKIEELSEALIDDATLTRTLRIDCELPLSVIDQNFYNRLYTLSPFGMGNPEPTFLTKGVEVCDIRVIGRDSKHIKLIVSTDSTQAIEAIGFGLAEQARNIKIGDYIDIVYTVDENTWNGRKRLQLKIKDMV